MKVNPKIDLAFKKLFGSEENTDILLSLINAILPTHEQISELTLLNPYNVSDYIEGKLSILDIRAQDKDGVQYDIEMQLRGYEFYGRRTLYYWAKMFGTQLDYTPKNDTSDDSEVEELNRIKIDSKPSDYSELKKCIVISLIDFNFFKDKRYNRYFMLKDAETNDIHTDLDYLNLYFVEMKKFKDKLEPTRTILERWINFLNYAHNYTNDNLPQELAEIKEIRKASLKLDTMYLNEKERMDYNYQEKFYFDDKAIKRDLMKKAEAKGLKKGIEQGIEQEKIEIAVNLKNLGISIEDISKATGLSKEKIEKL